MLLVAIATVLSIVGIASVSTAMLQVEASPVALLLCEAWFDLWLAHLNDDVIARGIRCAAVLSFKDLDMILAAS